MRTHLRVRSAMAALIIAAAPGLGAAASEQRGARPDSQKQQAQKHEGASHTLVTPADVEWAEGPAALPRGAQAAVLEGDPSKKGIFTLRVKMPAGYRIPPHTHPKAERVTVISGTVQLGMGRTWDESKFETLEAGSLFIMPPGMEHFAQATEETVIQLTGEGPWDLKYVRESDDPRKRRAGR